MKLRIIAVGVKMPYWVDEACREYLKRIPSDYLDIQLKEIKPEPRTQTTSRLHWLQAEAKRIHAQIRGHYWILDETGQVVTSTALTTVIQQWRQHHDELSLIIGGPDGLDASLKEQAEGLLQLSALTLPHGMVRVLLAEQLYRCWSIQHDHPYHRS